MTLRLLMVSDVYPPLIGGADRQTQLLSKELVRRGYSVSVATLWQPGFQEREDDDGVQVYRFKGIASRVPWFSVNPARRHHPPVPDPGIVWALWRLIQTFDPHVIQCYGWVTYSCAVALLGKDIPMIVSMRDYGHTCALRTMLQYGNTPCSGPALGKCIDCATHFYGMPKGLAAVFGVFSTRPLLRHKIGAVHSISAYIQDLTWRDLFDRDTILKVRQRPIPDALIPSFRESRPTDGGNDKHIQVYLKNLPDKPFILFVGALRMVKGLKPLLSAYAQLNNAPPLVLIGPRTPDTPSAFPPNVIVLYDFPHPAVMKAWKRCLFGVAPSLWPEPFGSVVHEAMSQGKAIIGTTPGGHTDMIIDGETGFLVPPGDVDALRNAMQRLIDDQPLRDRLGAAAYMRSQIFTSDVVVPQFEQLYQQLVTRVSKHTDTSATAFGQR